MDSEHQTMEAMEKRLEERFEARLQDSHMSVAKILSDNGAAIRDLTRRFDNHDIREAEDRATLKEHIREGNEILSRMNMLSSEDIQALKEVAKGYSGIGVIRKALLAIGGAAASITAVIYMLKAFK